jgi:hypothetical protein
VGRRRAATRGGDQLSVFWISVTRRRPRLRAIRRRGADTGAEPPPEPPSLPYRFARERVDYPDFASGRVFRSLPGRTAFPVRLADELFQHCLALGPAGLRDEPAVLYDPCRGGASLVCAVALPHWRSLRQIVASDVDREALGLARLNLAPLTPEGLAARREQLAALYAAYGKTSHTEALARAARLAARVRELSRARPLPTRVFLANALDPADLRAHVDEGAVDVAIADVPYGQRSRWLGTERRRACQQPLDRTADDTATIWRLLEAIRPVLAPGAVVAVVGDKAQRTRHERYAQAGKLQIGRRRATFLTVS